MVHRTIPPRPMAHLAPFRGYSRHILGAMGYAGANNMERIDPAYQDNDGDIPERINDALDPHSISPADIESDDYDGSQSVEEYLRNPKRRKS